MCHRFRWMRNTGMSILSLGGMALLALGKPDEPKTIKAPPNHAIVSQDLKGWYFAPLELKNAYDSAVGRLEALKKDIDEGRVKAPEAKATLDTLRRQLQALAKDLEAKKVFVAGAKVFEQTETIEFPLGAEQKIAITANQIQVKGWAGPHVKCELKKMVISPEGKPVDDHLKALKIIHKVGRAEFAGNTPEEAEKNEKEYLEKEGAKLTKEQLLGRKRLVDEIQNYRSFFRDFAGKTIDLISVEGLDYQSNPWVLQRVSSEGGSGVYGGQRQRYGILTVYLPKCSHACLLGAKRGLAVEDVETNLVIDGEGSTDQDHLGSFTVKNLKGNLSARNFPLNQIHNIHGKVQMMAKQEFGRGGGGTSNHDDLRDMYPPPPMELSVSHITGPVFLRLGKCNLDLKELDGPIDIENDFGDTIWTNSRPLAKSPHRIVTESGSMNITLNHEAWDSGKILAATSFGFIRTNAKKDGFEEFRQTIAKSDGTGFVNWNGFETRDKDQKKERFRYPPVGQEIEGILKEVQGENRLNLINRAGRTFLMQSGSPEKPMR